MIINLLLSLVHADPGPICQHAGHNTADINTTCLAGSINAQAMACSSMRALAGSDNRHAAVFARAGAIPWLVGLIRQCPDHACGGNAAAAVREILQDQSYHVSCLSLKSYHL